MRVLLQNWLAAAFMLSEIWAFIQTKMHDFIELAMAVKEGNITLIHNDMLLSFYQSQRQLLSLKCAARDFYYL